MSTDDASADDAAMNEEFLYSDKKAEMKQQKELWFHRFPHEIIWEIVVS